MEKRRIKLPSLMYNIGDEPIDFESTKNYKVNKISYAKFIDLVKAECGDNVWARLLDSFLGPVLTYEQRKFKMSGKLLHYVLSRNIKTSRQNELWFHFGGRPMRFSIREYQMVTGLKCYGEEDIKGLKDQDVKWDYLRRKKKLSMPDLSCFLVQQDLDEDDKYSLALLLLVKSMFVAKNDKEFVEEIDFKMASKLPWIENFPWGKTGFSALMTSLKHNITNKLGSDWLLIYGYPVAFELWILESIPALAENCKVDTCWEGYLCLKFNESDSHTFRRIRTVEDRKPKVIMILGDLVKDMPAPDIEEEDEDPQVNGMMEVVKSGYRIRDEDWKKGFVDLQKAVDVLTKQRINYHAERQADEQARLEQQSFDKALSTEVCHQASSDQVSNAMLYQMMKEMMIMVEKQTSEIMLIKSQLEKQTSEMKLLKSELEKQKKKKVNYRRSYILYLITGCLYFI